MYEEDIDLLVCPRSRRPLILESVDVRAPDGEIEEGRLKEPESGRSYAIRNGIPRFVEESSYNASWDYKWRVLDGGEGLNYRIIDKSDVAYQIHDLFDRNDHKAAHGSAVYERARGGVALDLGCGVGQYSVRLLKEFSPKKLVSLDLTGGVDVFRTIVKKRYPELLPQLLIVQASVFEMPFRDEQFDFIMSLGVLMHTGNTRQAITEMFRRLKVGGHVNFWIYCSENVAYSVAEPNRSFTYTMTTVVPIQKMHRRVAWWIRLFRGRMPHSVVVRFLKFMSSDFMYKLMQRNGFRWMHQWFPTVVHPDYAYRLINNYDGYVNTWCDTWNEKEIFPTLRENGLVIRGMSDWRLGLWAIKDPDFYER